MRRLLTSKKKKQGDVTPPAENVSADDGGLSVQGSPITERYSITTTPPDSPLIQNTAARRSSLGNNARNVNSDPDARPNDLFTGTQNSGEKKKRNVDFLVIVLHGIGANPEALEKNKQDFLASLKTVKNYWFWEIDIKIHIEFIDWKAPLFLRQQEIFQKLLPSEGQMNFGAGYPSNPRHLLTNALSDLICYFTPPHGDGIIESAIDQLNTRIAALQSIPKYQQAKIILIGHSLGGIILHEILTGQTLRPHSSRSNHEPNLQPLSTHKDPASDLAYQSSMNSRHLNFSVEEVFLFGCPLAAFYVLHQETYPKLYLPYNTRFYNVYHPHDPVAFRLEPLYYTALDPLPPAVILPYWKNNGPREYIRWSRDAQNVRRLLVDYVRGVTANASDKIRKMLGQRYPAADPVFSSQDDPRLSRTTTSRDMAVNGSHPLPSNQSTSVRHSATSRIGLRDSSIVTLENADPGISTGSEVQDDYTSQYVSYRKTTLLGTPVVQPQPSTGGVEIESVTLDTTIPGNATVSIHQHFSNPQPVTSLIPAAQESLTNRSRQKAATGPTHRAIHLKILARKRYGTHDRKPLVFSTDTNVSSSPKNQLVTANEEGDPELLKRPSQQLPRGAPTQQPTKAATLRRLLRALELDVENEDVRSAVYNALSSSSAASLAQLQSSTETATVELPPLTQEDKVDIFSECELGGGLELPVRLDFELQELTAEHYVVSLGNVQSHFNYWTSNDTALFILKEMTGFRPRVRYPDFVKLLELTETRKGSSFPLSAQIQQPDNGHSPSPVSSRNHESRSRRDAAYDTKTERSDRKKTDGGHKSHQYRDDKPAETTHERRRSSRRGSSHGDPGHGASLLNTVESSDDVNTLSSSTVAEPRRMPTMRHLKKPSLENRGTSKGGGHIAGHLFFS